jgi:hypothetical protein
MWSGATLFASIRVHSRLFFCLSSPSIRGLDEDRPHFETGLLFLHDRVGGFGGESVGGIEHFGDKTHVTGSCEMDAGTC